MDDSSDIERAGAAREGAPPARPATASGLVVVDYLQLMRPEGRPSSRVEQIGQISRGLKILARELNMPVIAVSQLSRAVESRNPPVPMLSDLREAGGRVVSIEPEGVEEVYDLTVEGLHNFVAEDIVVHNSIEQDADVVMFIYRDEYYNRESERLGEADVIVAKHRNGPDRRGRAHVPAQVSEVREPVPRPGIVEPAPPVADDGAF